MTSPDTPAALWDDAGSDREERFRNAVAAALEEDEIIVALARTRIDPLLLRRRLGERRDAILGEVAKRERALGSAEAALAAGAGALTSARRNSLTRPLEATAILIWIVVGVVLLQGGFALLDPAVAWLGSVADDVGWPFTSAVLVVAAGIGAAAVASHRRGYASARELIGLDSLRDALDEASHALDSALVQVATAEARDIISRLSEPEALLRLDVTDAPGLAELRGSRFDIETAAFHELSRVVASMPGGTIGVAGPRGVGKTKLLGAFNADTDAVHVMVGVPVRYDSREFFIYVFEQVCEALVGRLPDAVVLGSRTVAPARGAPLVQAYLDAARRLAGRPPRHTPSSDLDVGQRTVRMLRELRYERSYLMGVTGEFALSKVLKVGAKAERQTMRVPWSLPQLVHEFRDFVRWLAKERRVVIAIDELDKIASAEDAVAFLNELKAIFGIPGAYFLVSVSEDALASFERRGQPVRDAFDSAFDEILPVAPLTASECDDLLRRRVIGMTWPFVAIAAAMGGGLPREVIRVARACVLAGQDVGPELYDLLPAVVSAELAAAARGARYRITAHPGDPGATEVVEWLERLQRPVSVAALREMVLDADTVSVTLAGIDLSENVVPVHELLDGVRVRIVFGLTLMQVLGADARERLSSALSDGWVDRLIRARAAFAMGTGTAEAAITRLRTDAGLG